MIKSSDEGYYAFEILKVVEKVNANPKSHLVEKIKSIITAPYKTNIFFCGIGLQVDTDFIREGPVLYLIDALTKAGAKVTAFDFDVMPKVWA